MKSGDAVRYINSVGGEHNALVMNENILNEGVLDLVYVDAEGKLQQVFGVVHESHSSKDDNNPEAERTVLHAWREFAPVAPAAVDAAIFAHVDAAVDAMKEITGASPAEPSADDPDEKPPVIQ